jgi:hypothetical protein
MSDNDTIYTTVTPSLSDDLVELAQPQTNTTFDASSKIFSGSDSPGSVILENLTYTDYDITLVNGKNLFVPTRIGNKCGRSLPVQRKLLPPYVFKAIKNGVFREVIVS